MEKSWEATSLVKHAREAVRKQAGHNVTDESEVSTNDFSNDTQKAVSVPETSSGSLSDIDDAVNLFGLVWQATLHPLRTGLTRILLSQTIAAQEDVVSSTDVAEASTGTSTVLPGTENPVEASQDAGPSLPPVPSPHPQDYDYSLLSLAWSFVPLKRLWRPTWHRALVFLQGQYDLRPYGLGVTVDFGWAGQRS